jgi:acetoacetyl-CoA synthetase
MISTDDSVSADVLWRPSSEWLASARMTDYLGWLERERQLSFADYAALWRWSVDDLDAFWSSIWEYFGVISSATATTALADDRMPGASWFPGARLNWAENLLRVRPDEGEAIIGVDESGAVAQLSWAQLRAQVAGVAATLREWGVRPGDRVGAYLPNCPETVIALLATASVGAVWCCCAPDFSATAAADRLAPLEPRVLFAVDGYQFNGREVSRAAEVAELRRRVPSVEQVVTVSRRGGRDTFTALRERSAEPNYEQVPFDHPLWVLSSSGTTGAPKGIVHSHGGILLESLKANALHYDLRPQQRVFIAASTAWVVWNMLVDAMCVGATIVTYDGSPVHQSPDRLLALAAEHRVTRFGTGAAYLATCQRSGTRPNEVYDFGSLRTIMTTGSPLPHTTWRWVYDAVKSDVLLGSDSGGTDVATGFIGTNPLLPVRAGVCQSAGLGVLAQAWDEAGGRVLGELGELVITRPMPSMPISFFGDLDGDKYRDAYFDVFPGVWRHGDWVTEDGQGGFVVHGRSDTTINRGGVRMGSADIYAALATCPEVVDSLVIGAELPDGEYYMPLFVQLVDGVGLDDVVRDRLRNAIRSGASPRHVPDEIVAVPDIPLTRTGKKLEIAVKRLLQGTITPETLPTGVMQNPAALDWYVEFAARFRSGR